MPSIFAEDQRKAILDDGLTTKAECAEIIKQADTLALGGGCVLASVDPLLAAQGESKPYVITFANGQQVNAGVLQTALRNAKLHNKLAEIQAEYAKPGLNGPAGINWLCTEAEYHAARTAAAAVGLPVMGGGPLASTGMPNEELMDVEAFGRTSFPPPAAGNAKQNFVIAFQATSGNEAPVCNAAFLAHMVLSAGAAGAKAFFAARQVPKGWRA